MLVYFMQQKSEGRAINNDANEIREKLKQGHLGVECDCCWEFGQEKC